MKLYQGLHLVLALVTVTTASDISVKGDLCSKFDSCYSKSQLRTCSCAHDCHMYETCCHDLNKPKSVAPSVPFHCYHGRTITPVFVKRSCVDDFEGHIHVKTACFDDDIDAMDVSNNLLVTSHVTKTTYWNLHCAICSNEANADLELWSVEVFCPPKDEVDRKLIRRNLTYDQDTRQWGRNISGEFLECAVKYTPPPYIDEVKHCTPNLISSCPHDYDNKDIADKCYQYYGERKHKHSNKFYRNIHCAICNGMGVEDLECPGISKPEDDVEDTDFREMVEEVFTKGQWLEKEKGQRFQCSKGFLYDPTWKKCRKFNAKMTSVQRVESSSQRSKLEIAMLSIVLLAFLL